MHVLQLQAPDNPRLVLDQRCVTSVSSLPPRNHWHDPRQYVTNNQLPSFEHIALARLV
jgi:hypothetical protein